MIIQNTRDGNLTDMTFTVPKPDYKKAMAIIEKIAKQIGAEKVTGSESIAKVSIVGVGMRNHAGIATTMFKVLSDEGINIMMISTSEIKVSCVVDEKYTELAVRALHDAFGLDKAAKKGAKGCGCASTCKGKAAAKAKPAAKATAKKK